MTLRGEGHSDNKLKGADGVHTDSVLSMKEGMEGLCMRCGVPFGGRAACSVLRTCTTLTDNKQIVRTVARPYCPGGWPVSIHTTIVSIRPGPEVSARGRSFICSDV